jgi:hypothetical protein
MKMKINIKKFATKSFILEKTPINNTPGFSGTQETGDVTYNKKGNNSHKNNELSNR